MNGEKFCHLHNHSYYSLLDGLSPIEDMVDCAVTLGFKSLALTDHGTCSGLLHFQEVCHEKGIKPILGMEAYTCRDHTIKDKTSGKYNHLIILAKNKAGYKNLIRLSSLGYTEGFYYKARIDFNMLEKHREGLIVSTACIAGEIPQLILKGEEQKAEELAGQYKEVFKDDFYFEVMAHKYFEDKEQEHKEKEVGSKMYKLGKKMGIKTICTQDMHYARKEDWNAHDVLLSMQTIDTIKNPDRLSFGSDDFYMKPYEEMADIYQKAPEVLLNTVEISEKIENDVIEFPKDLLPNIDVPPEFKDDEAYLKALVSNGMKQKGLFNIPEYRKRIQYEISIIIKCKYVKYFLVLWDIVNFARSQNIRCGVGRGSGVSSLCLYVLDITRLDPLKYDLIFERFLNPDRVSAPDVDMDFDYDRRGEVYNYVVNKYGSEYCCQIGTYNKYKARLVIKGCAKAFDIGNDWEKYVEDKKNNPSTKVEMGKTSLKMADFIAKQVPFKAVDIKEALKSSRDFANTMHKYPKLLECARHIEGTLYAAGVHPAGIIVSKNKVIDHVPLRVSKGVICSQYDKEEIEKVGLLKFDLLAIKTLTVMDKTLKMIEKRHNKQIDIDKLDPTDNVVLKSLMKSTVGIFQFESEGMAKLLNNIKVDAFEDLIVANALYRPGPLGEGMHDMYAEYKRDPEKIKYIHPKMGEILKETYGIFVFQENLMKVSQEMAGFTGGQADILRKVVGKKDPSLIKKEKLDDLFVEGCVKNGISKEIAIKIFEQMYHFAGYGFNKSHSAAYGFIAYQTAWLRHYYPIEYMCNLLTSEINNTDKGLKMSIYWDTTSEKMRIPIYKAHINKSGHEFIIDRLEGKEILRAPFTMLKGVGSKSVDSIVKGQPYKDLEDFVRRTDARVVNTRVFSTIVEAGCMDEAWKLPRALLLKQYDELKKKIEKEKKEIAKAEKKKVKGASLFNEFNGIEETELEEEKLEKLETEETEEKGEENAREEDSDIG